MSAAGLEKCVYELSKREMQIKGSIKISSLKLLSSTQCAFDGAGKNISHSCIRKCGGAIFHCRALQIFKNTQSYSLPAKSVHIERDGIPVSDVVVKQF